MKNRIVAIAAACLFVATTAFAVETEQDKKDHEELRGLLKLFTEAFNSRNIEPLTPYLHKDFNITTPYNCKCST